MKLRQISLACVVAALGVAVGCSSSQEPTGSGSVNPTTAGSISLALDAGGVQFDTVAYSITGPHSFTKTGNIDVSKSGSISATIGPIPAGTGFEITLTTTSSDGTEACSGSATFNVTAHQVTSVSVHLTCHQGTRNGSVLVNGTLNVCPVIDAIAANPTEVLVGGAVGLNASAEDADSGPSPLSYQWTASSGVLSNASIATPRFTCTTPGPATLTVSVSDGDPAAGCADTQSVTVNCTAIPASNTCALGNGAGPIKHVIYLQFDNTHLTRDRPNVPSDLEQMPHLLNFIRNNGTMMANDHTILISHTAGGILSSLTGVYPDRNGQTVTNSYVRTSPTGAFSFPSSFQYWTDTVAAGVPNMVTPDGKNVPAPWVMYTRAGCDVGGVAIANVELENTSTSTGGDILTVFGAGSSQVAEAQASASAASGSAARNKAVTDFEGIAIHCAAGSTTCAAGENDALPDEPGGYAGHKGLFGAQQVDPVLTGKDATVPLTDMLGNPITDSFGQPGFPGFNGMTPAVSLAYVASMHEHGVPVTYAYISDAHDDHGLDGSGQQAFGPGQTGYEKQLQAYDQAFANFFARLAADGLDKSNTLFVITVDEGDHFAGGTPNPSTCDGVNTPCDWTGQIGEINANIDTLVQHQFPSLFASFLASTGPNTFTVHGDSAPPFYLAKKGAGALGQTDPDARAFEQTIAGVTAVNPYTGATDNVLTEMADQTGMKAIHMFTTGDPARNGTFAFFANANYFVTDFPTSTCETCVVPTFAWNHGDVQKEIGQTWIGFVGPGVASQPDQTVFTDHTDVRPTINALVGLSDTYQGDGRVITQALVPGAVPPAIGSNQTTFESLSDYYKRINAPFGQFAGDVLLASTKALASHDSGDATYTATEASIANLTAQRNALASQIRDALDGAAFGSQPIDATQAASWISQAQVLLASADALVPTP